MGRLSEGMHAIAVAAWAGALWSIGLLAGPAVYTRVPDRAVALAVEARLLLYVALVSLVCSAFLLLLRLVRFGGGAFRHAFFWLVVVMLLLTAVTQFGQHELLNVVRGQPTLHGLAEAFLRDRRATWGGVPSVAYLVQCVLAVPLVVLQQSAPR